MSTDAIEAPDTRNITEYSSDVKEEQILERDGRNIYGLFPVFLLVLVIVLRMSWSLYRSFVVVVPVVLIFFFTMGSAVYSAVQLIRQKTRNPQQRRMYVGSRPRASLTPQEPTIYVSPSNLPPPPKYECMAPPSYEEVVGIHYPNYQNQPITQPIASALNQGSSTTPPEIVTSVITVNETTVASEQRRTSITVARS